MRKIPILLIGFVLYSSNAVFGQGSQTTMQHQQWYSAFSNIRLSENYSLATDAQFIEGSFALFRAGIIKHFPHQVNLTVGHAVAWLAVPGTGSEKLDRKEQRPWLQVQVPTDLNNKFTLSHRLRYELRLQEHVENGLVQTGDYRLINRFRMQEAIKFTIIDSEKLKPYLVLSNEVFLTVMNPHAVNVFDQNRLALAAGLHFRSIRLQSGYMSRIIQSATVPGRYTHNHTFTLALFHSLDMRKAPEKTNPQQ